MVLTTAAAADGGPSYKIAGRQSVDILKVAG